jgi:hypothetical protein
MHHGVTEDKERKTEKSFGDASSSVLNKHLSHLLRALSASVVHLPFFYVIPVNGPSTQ